MSLNFVIPEFNINGAGTPPLQFFRRGFNLGGGSAQPSWKDVVISGIGSLTLVNAKANGLNYLKLFGGTEQVPETYIDSVTLEGKCEQRNVPEGYTQLEYLESSGTQYFNSGVMPNQDTSVEMKAQLFDSSTTRFFAAYAPAGGTPYYGVGFSTSGKWVNQTKTSNQVTAVNADTNLHTIYKNKNILYIDGTQIDDSGSGDFTLNYPIYLLAANVGGSTSFISAGKIYYTKIWDNNTLIRNFIPCRRNSDNILGMYDTVTGTFFTNSGTGDFIAGSAVTPTPTNPIDIVCNNGAIKYSANIANVNAQTALVGYYISNTGVVTADVGNWMYQDYIPVKPSTTYTLSISSPCYYATISEYSTADDSGFITRNAKASPVTFITITTSSTTNYIRFGTNIDRTEVTLDEVLAINWMLNQGDSMAYQPYVEGGIYYDGTVETVTDSNQLTATAQPLLSVGDYKDTQEVLSGAVTRNVGIKVFDGTETFTTSSSGAMIVAIPDVKIGAENVPINTHFTLETSPTSIAVGTQRFGASDTQIYSTNYYMKPLTTMTASDFKQWLAQQYANGTPVIVVYPNSSATTETVTPQVLQKSPVTYSGSITGLTGTVVESSHTVPTPTQPLDIVANNGVIKVSPNLFNKAGNMTAGYINSSGSLISSQSSAARVSDYIEIKPSTTYVISGTGDVAAASFDRYAYTYTADKTPIAQVPSIRGGFAQSFTTANNAKFIRVQCLNNNINTCQLELGSTATTYRPYGSIYYDGTVETVGVFGKNLFDKALFNTDVGSTINYTTYEIPNGTYTMSTNFPIGNNVTNVFIFTGEVTSGAATTTNGVYDGQSQTITVTDGKYTVAYRSTTSSSSNTNNPKDYDFQLELGSTATTYEPYYNGGTATAQPLLKVGDYQDVQSVLDGAVTRNVGVKVLTGTEEGWSRNSDRASLLIPDILNGSNSWIPICTHYKAYHGGTSLANMDDNSCKITSGGKSLLIKDTTHNTSLTDFTDYIKAQYNAGLPVILVYPLATATTESVTGQPLTIQAGTNIVEITQASIDNLELEVSYKAGVEVTVEEIEAVNNDESVEVTING